MTTMNVTISRRTFSKAALGAAADPALRAAGQRKLQIGYTCLTWNAVPRTPEALEPSLKDISDLGFYRFETFCEILEDWDTKGALRGLIDRNRVPLCSGYCSLNLIDNSLRKENLAKVIRWGKIVKKYGGTFVVLASNGVKREGYDFQANRANIVSSLNDYGMAIADLGLSSGLHQHTGTAIDTREETYAVMEAVNTKYVKFAPDVGQLQKSGTDAAKVVKDFLSILTHMHLKDYSGGQYFAGYCPLGQGKVDLVGILDMLEEAGKNPEVMIELDRAPDTPITALDTAKTSKAYLQKLGYKFRA
jgi:inosose dehydratase